MSTPQLQLSLREADPTPAPGDGIEREALVSGCGTYRWWLLRVWDRSKPLGVFVALNPSTADGNRDDPTLHSMMKRARAWGWGGFYVVNLYALRSPHPKELLTAPDPVGPRCDEFIVALTRLALLSGGRVVVAWGAFDFERGVAEDYRGRDISVLATLLQYAEMLYCIGTTESGAPKHPMARGRALVPVDTPLSIYRTRSVTPPMARAS